MNNFSWVTVMTPKVPLITLNAWHEYDGIRNLVLLVKIRPHKISVSDPASCPKVATECSHDQLKYS